MKAQIAKILFVACLGLFLSGCKTQGCYTCGSYPSTNNCGQDYPGSCTCTDPNCGKNPCLSTNACCKAFGNVGGSAPSHGSYSK